MNLQDQFVADAEEELKEFVPSDGDLAAISLLAERQLRLQKNVEEAETRLAELRNELSRVTNVDLPKAMERVRMSSFTLTNGSVIEVETKYFAGITEEKQAAAFKWFRDHGHGDLVKNVLSVPFGKGNDDKARELAAHLESMKIDFEQKESIHGSTLKAFVKEQMIKGKPLDMGLLGVHVVTVAEIKTPKKRKK